jgi:hypothetical protein
MKLQEFIKKELQLENDRPEAAIISLSKKETELNNLVDQLQQLKTQYEKQIELNYFDKWEKSLKTDFPSFEYLSDRFIINSDYINTGIKFYIDNQAYTALIEWSKVDDPNLYFGIRKQYGEELKHEQSKKLDSILKANSLNEPNEHWYGSKSASIESIYEDFKKLVNSINSTLKENA